MKRLITAVLLLILLAPMSFAGTRRTTHKQIDHRPKTVHVRPYTTKRGKHIAAYHRRRPRKAAH